MNTSDLFGGLARVGKLFYERMKTRLDGGGYPSTKQDGKRMLYSIQDATSVRAPEVTDGGAKVEVAIDLKKAPYAGAYEEGSGIHGEEGDKYTIKPKQLGGLLVFPTWEWPNWKDLMETDYLFGGAVPFKGFFFLSSVEHPGVDAKPYIQPTIQEIHPEVKQILAKEFKLAVLRDGTPMETIK